MTQQQSLDGLIQSAHASDYFSAPHASAEVARFNADGAQIANHVGASARPKRLVLVGSGGSLACLITAKYIVEQMTKVPVDVIAALEVRWRAPLWLDQDCLVVFNSWSGRNSDVLDAVEYCAGLPVQTAAIVARLDSALATSVDHVIPYSGLSIYEIPIIAVLQLVLGFDRGTNPAQAQWQRAIDLLPQQLAAVQDDARSRGEAEAAQLADSAQMYVLAAGPSSSLGLKLANVLMENVRIGAAYYDTAEFRHGAVEALERHRLDVLSFVGTDDSRVLSGRVTDMCRAADCRVVVYDAAELDLEEPLFAPLLFNSYTQWFVAYSAFARGITNLDERVHMGKATLSEGQWP